MPARAGPGDNAATLQRRDALMPDPNTPWLTGLVVVLTLGSTLALALRPRKSDAEVLFAVFCGSMSIFLLRPWVGPDQDWLWWGVAVGGCATCNAYWLVARALFRGDGAVGRTHVAVAIGISALVIGWRAASAASGESPAGLAAVVGALLTLASSTVLVLAFLEALRGWSASMPRAERRLRAGFMGVYGGCVLAATVSASLADAFPGVRVWLPQVVTLCALTIVVFTLWALRERRRAPYPPVAQAAPPAASAGLPREEDRALADAILRLLEVEAVYREPELKVADLAARLGSAEHKVSRAITQVLGERNFNRMVNRHRIAHACRALADPRSTRSVLEISADAGFASLGPFNRAFKLAMGCTPSAYRAAQRRDERVPPMSPAAPEECAWRG